MKAHNKLDGQPAPMAGGPAKEVICRKFSRAAEVYEDYAQIQVKCAFRLLQTLPLGLKPDSILEIGCGSGNYSRLLKEKFPKADFIALDFSEEMIKMACRKTKNKDIIFLKREAEEYLAEQEREFSLITSNATLQWFKDLPGSFQNMAEILTGNGLVHFSIFGCQSLAILGMALREVVDPSIVLPSENFSDYAFLQETASSYFNNLKIEEINFEKRVNSFLEILRQIHYTGTGGYMDKPPRFTRRVLAELDKYLASRDGYNLNYQVFFLTAGEPK